jgi:hypothetical protein
MNNKEINENNLKDKDIKIKFACARALTLFINAKCNINDEKLQRYMKKIKFSDSDITYDFTDVITQHLQNFISDTDVSKKMEDLCSYKREYLSRNEIEKLFGVRPVKYWIDYKNKIVYVVDDIPVINI